jgi:ornithine carbamoyltransferase
MSEFEDGEIGEEINLEDTVSVLSNYIDSIETDVDKEQVKTFMKTLYTEAINVEV